MKRLVDWRIFSISILAASLVAWALHAWSALNLWASVAIVVGAMLVNGVVALIEDEMPGGFGKPKSGSQSDEAP
jgi:hypothetical protein